MGLYPEACSCESSVFLRVAWIPAFLTGIQASSADIPKTTCVSCHSKESARWAASAIGPSIVSPALLQPAHVRHELSQSVLTRSEVNGQMVHGLSERGLTANYPIRYQIGGEFMGRTFMVQVGGYMFESPLTYFKRYGWDLSPGYSTSSGPVTAPQNCMLRYRSAPCPPVATAPELCSGCPQVSRHTSASLTCPCTERLEEPL